MSQDPNSPFLCIELDPNFVVTSVAEGPNPFDIDPLVLVGKAVEQLVPRRARRDLNELDQQRSRFSGGLIDVVLQLEIDASVRLVRLRAAKHGAGWRAWLENLIGDKTGPDRLHLLEVENTWWRHIVTRSDEGVVVLGTEGEVLELNQSALDFLAVRSERDVLLSREVLLGSRLLDDLPQAVFGEVTKAVETGRTKKRHRFESTLKHLGKHFDVRVVPIHVPVRGYVGACIIMRDVSSRVLIEQMSERLREKNANIASMLANLDLGILTVQDDLTVHAEYSARLERLLGHGEIAGHGVLDAVFRASTLGPDRLGQLEAGLTLSLGQDMFVFECNLHCFPRTFELVVDGKLRAMEADWVPLASNEDELERIMLVLRDVTEVLELRAQAEAQSRELGMVGELLAMAGQDFERFEHECSAGLLETRQQLAADDPAQTVLAKRTLHTLKGNARSWGLRRICDDIHAAEERLREDAPFDEVDGAVGQALATLELYRELSRTKLNRATHSGAGAGAERRDLATTRIVDLLVDRQIEGSIGLPPEIAALVMDAAYEPLEHTMRGISDEIADTAMKAGKRAPAVEVTSGICVRDSHAGKLRGALVLMLTNAVDHGLERPEVREADGKGPAGRICVDARVEENGHVVLRISDDGRGLSLTALRAKLGGDAVLDAATAESLIFSPGLSTSEEITLTSGRGMGLDAVAEMARSWGGALRLVFLDPEEPRATSERAMVAFELSVPESIVRFAATDLSRAA